VACVDVSLLAVSQATGQCTARTRIQRNTQFCCLP